MIGPALKDVPHTGPVRPDAVERAAVEKREEAKSEGRTKVANAESAASAQTDEVVNAEGVEQVQPQAPLSLSSSSRLDIDRDKVTGNVVYTFTDRVTGEVVRQLPPEEMIEQAQRLAANRKGLLVDETV